MTLADNLPGKTYIARHGETVFNAAARLQGEQAHTPLTRTGFAQADEMGVALRRLLGAKPSLTLWASNTGRALQTLAIIAEHLELDWHQARQDVRLAEIGMGGWDGMTYDAVGKRWGDFYDPVRGVFTQTAPQGEDYPAVAVRLRSWVSDAANDGAMARLVIMHGVSGSVLRGLLAGGEPHPVCGTPLGARLPQGSVSLVEEGVASVAWLGEGLAPA